MAGVMPIGRSGAVCVGGSNLSQNEAAQRPGAEIAFRMSMKTRENAAAQIYLIATQRLRFNQFSVRFPTVISAGAKIFSRLKKGHPFCPFSRASDQSRNLAETSRSLC
ncbi:hypothetical protein [Roseibium sediminicola]|uniref:Uncharacterized protein n=1 Tax=Roseibium sediminicola TaxID=2933272 RepID=A0ABT0GXZ6_9HYPH|nr:hypothetical protein [Roseibium sp. CAU 1639]MCK7614319.1 hypothetical protein [Roseibium sp. CAU 1639]